MLVSNASSTCKTDRVANLVARKHFGLVSLSVSWQRLPAPKSRQQSCGTQGARRGIPNAFGNTLIQITLLWRFDGNIKNCLGMQGTFGYKTKLCTHIIPRQGQCEPFGSEQASLLPDLVCRNDVTSRCSYLLCIFILAQVPMTLSSDGLAKIDLQIAADHYQDSY